MKIVKRIARVVFPVLSVLMITFIFYQSSMDADASSVESGSLLEMINGFLSSLGISPFVSDHLIRKAAHFSEYFILGTLLFASMKVWLSKDVLILTYPAGAGLLVALSDEFIQTFSNGRSSEFKDVLLDLAGVLTAIVALYFLLWLIRDIRKNRAQEEETEDGSENETADQTDEDAQADEISEESEEEADEEAGIESEEKTDDDIIKEPEEESKSDSDDIIDNDTDLTEKRETQIE
ncbi:MAG: VanZ family protein [Ruminococcus sp.]|nr:VanZ family protein [Ruminococcus sp.]